MCEERIEEGRGRVEGEGNWEGGEQERSGEWVLLVIVRYVCLSAAVQVHSQT